MRDYRYDCKDLFVTKDEQESKFSRLCTRSILIDRCDKTDYARSSDSEKFHFHIALLYPQRCPLGATMNSRLVKLSSSFTLLIHLISGFSFQASKRTNGEQENCLKVLFSKSNDIFQDETPEDRNERMELVRQIQGTFYREENDDYPLVSRADEGVYTRVPLFRVQWTELPGYQTILNIQSMLVWTLMKDKS